MKPQLALETSVTYYPSTHYHIPEDLKRNHTSVTTSNGKAITIILQLPLKNLKLSPRLRGKSKEIVISVSFKRTLAALNSTTVITNTEVFYSTELRSPLWGQSVYCNRTVLLMEYVKEKKKQRQDVCVQRV
jgi:predicted enzyme involved in methoxymalonyl-ACP biosynthesis